MMPGIDGYETCRHLRADPVLRWVKVIMVSAKAMVSERLQGYEAGGSVLLSVGRDAYQYNVNVPLARA